MQASGADTWVIRHAAIVNKRGLHARAAAKFVKLAAAYDAVVEVEKADLRVDGTSIMDLMMLVASQGSQITILANGVEAEAAATALCDLVARKFDETE